MKDENEMLMKMRCCRGSKCVPASFLLRSLSNASFLLPSLPSQLPFSSRAPSLSCFLFHINPFSTCPPHSLFSLSPMCQPHSVLSLSPMCQPHSQILSIPSLPRGKQKLSTLSLPRGKHFLFYFKFFNNF